MKIDFKNVDSTIKNLVGNKNFKAVLFYGENSSAVDKRFKTVIDLFKTANYEVSDISLDLLKENKTLLTEEFFATSMFSEKVLYTLRLLEKENSYSKYLEDLFEKNDVSEIDNFLIITAGALDTSSSLRKYAEKSKFIACIGCYEEESKNMSSLINTRLKENGFNFTYDVVEYIINNVGNDAIIVENEIKKIILYKGDDKNLTLEDVSNCIVDMSKVSVDDFCNNFSLFNRTETFRNLHKLFEENVDVIVMIRALVRSFLQLQKIRFLVDSGELVDEVLKNEKVFWKQQNNVKMQLRKWSLNKINRFLEMLLNLEKNIKFNETKNLEFENFVLKSMLVLEK